MNKNLKQFISGILVICMALTLFLQFPEKSSASTTIEVNGGEYYFYTYPSTYGNLSFNVQSNAYCTVLQGKTDSNAGYYYYTLHVYPKDGGKNTTVEVYDNDSGKNIDLLVVHSNYQEAEAQTLCKGSSLEVSFETLEEISKSDVRVGFMGSDSFISCDFNSLTLESTVLHGDGIPRTYKYRANITLYTGGSYTVNLMDNASAATLVNVPVTVDNHQYDSGVVTKEPTPKYKGIRTKTCAICGSTVEEPIAKTPYNIELCVGQSQEVGIYIKEGGSFNWEEDYPKYQVTNQGIIDIQETGFFGDPDGTRQDVQIKGLSPGATSFRAVNNSEGTVGSGNVIVRDHYYEHVGTSEATCKEKAKETYQCIFCGDSYQVEVGELGEHRWSEDYTTDQKATCTESGVKSIHCLVCDEIESGTETAVPATGHNWRENYTTDKKPTCTDNGSESIHCSVCDVVNEGSIREIPASGHTWNTVSTVDLAPTCTEEGSESVHCVTCDEIKLGTEKTIPATGHQWSGIYTIDKRPTYTATGSESIHCLKCDAIRPETSREIPALERTPLDGATVSNVETKTYNGTAIMPKPIVIIDGKRLSEGVNYTCDYKDNVDAGTAKIIITGENKYCGTIEVPFTIAPASITDLSFVKAETIKNGRIYSIPKFTFTTENGNKYILQPGKDFTFKLAEPRVVEVEGKGNFSGIVTKRYAQSYYAEDDVKYSHAVISSSGKYAIWYYKSRAEDLHYRRSAIKMSGTGAFKVKEGYLEPVNSYTVTYKNNYYPGTATISFVFEDEKVDGSFKIRPAVIDDCTYPDSYSCAWYTSKPIEYHKLYNVHAYGNLPSFKEGEDYKITYKNNTKAGTGTMIVTGIGNCTGTVTKSFIIKKDKVGTFKGLDQTISNRTYTGKAIKPTIKKLTNDSGYTMVKGRDYSITYSNNVNVGRAKLIITGIGSCEGTKTLYFKINPKSTTISSVTAAKRGFTVKWKKQATQTTGYQIYYTTSSTKPKATTSPKATISKTGTVSKKVTGLTGGKKYYVYVRTYKTVNGVKYYSAWSKVRTVTTKK